MKSIGAMFGTLLVVLFEKGILNNEDLKRITGKDCPLKEVRYRINENHNNI